MLLLGVHPVLAQDLSINGYVRHYTGILLDQENEYSIVQNTVDLDLQQGKGPVAFKANPYIYHYRDREQEIGLRQAYMDNMDVYFRSMEVHVGKQQII